MQQLRRRCPWLSLLLLATLSLASGARAEDIAPGERKPVAAIVADWFESSHPEVLFTHVFQTYSRDGKGLPSQLEIVSVFRDLPDGAPTRAKSTRSSTASPSPTASSRP